MQLESWGLLPITPCIWQRIFSWVLHVWCGWILICNFFILVISYALDVGLGGWPISPCQHYLCLLPFNASRKIDWSAYEMFAIDGVRRWGVYLSWFQSNPEGSKSTILHGLTSGGRHVKVSLTRLPIQRHLAHLFILTRVFLNLLGFNNYTPLPIDNKIYDIRVKKYYIFPWD